MISATLALAALLPILPVFADPVPSEPAPGSVFNEGSTCHISWEADPDSSWKVMNIQLMTGDNFNMVHLTTVATVDGTDPANNSFDYPCPAVEPNSAIYFYQFSSPDSPDHTWTGRFAIASASGETVPEPESVQPGGAEIPWGTGRLENPGSAVPPPAYLGGGATTGGSGTPPTETNTTSSTTIRSTTTPTSIATVRTTPVATTTATTNSRTTTVAGAQGTTSANGSQTNENSANGAVGVLGSSSRVFTTGATLAAVALVFVAVL